MTETTDPVATFSEHALTFASGAWTELGVSGWTTSHGDWAIDPEPLILFTAWLGDRDPRLRDEATDWCIRNWRYISKARLRNLLRKQPHDVANAFGEFAATVGERTGVIWPGATEPRPYAVTGRSRLAPLRRPSLAWIRLRAMFGVSARAEILRCLLSHDPGSMSVVRLASASGYTKRNVADECAALERAGVLSVRSTGNRFYYGLARRAQLESFVGDLPKIRPDWTAMLNIARELVKLEEGAEGFPTRTLPVHVRKVIRLIQGELDELGIDVPLNDMRGTELWAAACQLGTELLGAWSAGRWTDPDGVPAEARAARQ
ncbi:MAG: winged helix-turn-helix domain-containing protein [Acidimicrobiales bacterium]